MRTGTNLAHRLPVRPQTALAVAGMALPVAYIVKKHVDWETKPDSKKRMLVHQLTFWSIAALSLKLLHDVLRKHRRQPWGFKAPRIALSGLLLVAGFEGGQRLARRLFPKQPAPIAPAPAPFSPPVGFPKIYVPRYFGSPQVGSST